MSGSYLYSGRDRRGGGHTGRTTENRATFIEYRYNKGWRSLTMTSAADGREVGGIHIVPGYKRSWWAESMDAADVCDTSGARDG